MSLSQSFTVIITAIDGTDVDTGASRAILNMADALHIMGRPCCEGFGLTSFEVIGDDGRKTGEIARRCNGCGQPYGI